MSYNDYRKCSKCGVSRNIIEGIRMHRFPRLAKDKINLDQLRSWAEFCFPDKNWSCEDDLSKLYTNNKLLCERHFTESSYTSSEKVKLIKFAIPSLPHDKENVDAEPARSQTWPSKSILTCRICLAEDVRMHSIAKTYLQDTYEKLTAMPLETKDKRPLQVCYICYARLRNCHRLQTRCLQSEEFFTQLLENNCLNGTPVKETNALKICRVFKISNEPETRQLGVAQGTEPVLKSGDVQVKGEPTEENTNTDQDVCRVNTNLEVINIPDDVYSEHSYVLTDDHTLRETEQLYEDEIDTVCGENPVTEPQVDHLRKIIVNDSFKSAHSIRSAEIISNKCTKAVNIVSNRIDLDHIKTSGQAQPKISENSSKLDEVRFGQTLDNIGQIQNKKSTKVKLLDISANKYDMCQKCFSHKISLHSHTCIRNGEKPYKCALCEKRFTQRIYLKRHIRNHDYVKPYQCDICGKCFKLKMHLKTHFSIHTDEKPYECDICQKRFTHKNHMKTHILVHSGQKSFKCTVCEKGFYHKISLENHICTHTGEQPSKCDICDKCFSVEKSFSMHVHSHTRENLYKCDVCGKCFNLKNNLIRHILLHIYR